MTADKIKKLRLSLGLSQSSFGQIIGVARITVTRWETGVRTPSPMNNYELEKIMRKVKNKS